MERRLPIILVALALVLGACTPAASGPSSQASVGTSSEPASEQPEPTRLLILLPFANPLSSYAVFVAEARGYYAEEGLEVEVEVADGSGAVVQQIVAGNADAGYAAPNPVILAAIEGQPVISYYVHSTRLPYSLVTPASTGITTIEDLAGGAIGISEGTGGEVLYISGLLTSEGIDAELVEAGGPDTASLALEEGRIDAYISSTSDIIPLQVIQEEKNDELVFLSLARFEEYFDSALVVTPETLEGSAEALTGLARATAKATLWAETNTPGTLAIIQEMFPEAVTDCDFALRRLEAGKATRGLTPRMNGQWGFNVGEIWQDIVDFLAESEEIPEQIDATTLFTNDLIDATNDFDADEVRADAEAFTDEADC